MSDNVYGLTQLVGTSKTSVEDAIQNAVTTASQTVRNIDWLEVEQIRGHVADGKVAHYQVVMRIGFRYEK